MEKPSDSLPQEPSPDSSPPASESVDRVTGQEASPFLWDAKIGDVDVDLFWDGYWRFSFIAGTGFGVRTETTLFPGLAQGAVFLQEPDVTLSFWLSDRWFIETTFLQGFEKNTYRAGYVGREEEFVQSVTIGNAGVTARPYASIEVPNPRYNTPGISARFASRKSEHEILLRYDPTEAQSQFFQGEYEVKTEVIELSDFLPGRYFIFPEAEVDQVSVWLEDRLGTLTGNDGRPYREAQPAEFFVDKTTGLVSLAQPHAGRVLGYYENSGGIPGGGQRVTDFIPSPDANLHPDLSSNSYEPFDFFLGTADPYDPEGRDFRDTSQVIIQGKEALILYDPGRFTPFERQNFYLTTRKMPQETWRIVPLLQDQGALYPSSSISHRWNADPEEKMLTAYGEALDLRAPENRYPFANTDPEIYGAGRERDPQKISQNILLAIRENNPGYFLDTGTVPSSIKVYINGIQDKSVQISENNTLVFNRFIFPNDWIEVTYRTEVLDLQGGDIYLYQGNRFQLLPQLSLDLAEEVRWNLSQDRAVIESGQSAGEIRLSSSLDWKSTDFSASLRGDGALRTPNTAGNLRLYGMESRSFGLIFSSQGLVPPPLTDTASPAPAGTYQPLEEYSYLSTNWSGQQNLNNYLWTGKSLVKEGEAPALAGALSGDPVQGRVFEERFDLDQDQWTAGDYLPFPGELLDLSGYTALTLYYRFLEPDGSGAPSGGGSPPRVRMIAGEIGQREDYDINGSVESFDPGLTKEWDLGPLVDAQEAGGWDKDWTTGDWRGMTIPLTADDRNRLSKVRGFRFVIENPLGETAKTARFILGQISFDGSPFRTGVRTPPPENALAPAQDISAKEVLDNSIKTAFPETGTLFHSSGEINQALRIRWGSESIGGSPLAGEDRWEGVSWFDPVPLRDYRTLVFYVRSSLAGEPLTALITDKDNQGIRVSWITPPEENVWDKITVDIDKGTADSAAGGSITAFSRDSQAGELTRFILEGVDEKGTGGSRSGVLYLDEIHFRDPAFTFTGGAELEAAWKYSEDVLTLGNFPVLGNISLEGRTLINGGKVLSGVDSGTVTGMGSLTAGGDVLGMNWEINWRGSWGQNRNFWFGSHSVRIPARLKSFWVQDTYAQTLDNDGTTISRSNALGLLGQAQQLNLKTSALYDGNTLTQTWQGDTGWRGSGWDTSLSLQYDLISNNSPQKKESYLSSWIHSYHLIAPVNQNVNRREGHHLFRFHVQGETLGVQWDPVLRFKTSQAPLWNQENRWISSLSFPLTFGKRKGWKLTPSYERDLQQIISTQDSGLNQSFGEAWQVLSYGLGRQFPLITMVPFREFFGSRDSVIFAQASQGMESVSYTPELRLALQRPGLSHFVDLFVPGITDFSLKRLYTRRGDVVGWQNDWNLSLTFTAYNLFGSFGRWPIISLYNSEEITNYLSVRWRDFNGPPESLPQELTWQSYLVFTGIRRRQLTLDNRITWQWDLHKITQEGRLEYLWRTGNFERIKIPFSKRLFPWDHYLESKERLIIAGTQPMKTAAPEDKGSITFTLYHETRWVFEEAGHLKAWLALGLGSLEENFVNGVELGIELEIRL